MRILHVISDVNIGGAGRYLLTLLRQPAFQAGAADVDVACPAGGELERELRRLGIEPRTFPGGDRSLHPVLLPVLVRLIRFGRYDIVHTHASAVARAAARLAGARVVVTKHGLGDGGAPPSGLAGFPRRALNRLAALAAADRVIAVSAAVAGRLRDEGVPGERIVVIPNGVDVEELDRAVAASDSHRVRAELAPGSGPLVGTVGRLALEKGQRHFLDAAAIIAAERPDVRYAIVGDGPLRQELAGQAVAAGIADRVVFCGYRPDAPRLVSCFDVFVLSSLTEGMSLALLEAMALARPVVATAVGGVPEAVSDGVNGRLVPPADPAAIAGTVRSLLADETLSRRLGEAARETVSSRFSAAVCARRVVEVYADLLAGGAS